MSISQFTGGMGTIRSNLIHRCIGGSLTDIFGTDIANAINSNEDVHKARKNSLLGIGFNNAAPTRPVTLSPILYKNEVRQVQNLFRNPILPKVRGSHLTW